MPVSFSLQIDGDNAEQFAAEWARVIPLLTTGGYLPDVKVDAEDKVEPAGEPVQEEVAPPKKPRGRPAKPTTIEGTATETKAEDTKTDAPPPADTKAPTADDIRAAFKVLMKESPKKEEAVYDILKEFKVKNASEAAALSGEEITKLIARCAAKVEEDKAAAVA